MVSNYYLGVVKTQWYDAWIQTKTLRPETSALKTPRELDDIHEYLNAVSSSYPTRAVYSHVHKFEMPDWVARVPNDVGYPAGGSLTSDEWKAMAMVYCPIVVRTRSINSTAGT